MRPYEVMIILDAGLEEDAIRAVLDRATQLLQVGGGSVGRVDRWGKRRFAYELHHRSRATTSSSKPLPSRRPWPKLDRMLSLADDVIRHKVIRLPERAAGGARPAPAPGPAAAAAPEAVKDANGA